MFVKVFVEEVGLCGIWVNVVVFGLIWMFFILVIGWGLEWFVIFG